MPARLRIHLPDGPVVQHIVEDTMVATIGRDTDCDPVLAHPSVSRHHARLFRTPDGWQLEDLDSKNGTRVDGERIAEAALHEHAWFAVGDVYCEFQEIDAEQRERLAARTRLRHDRSLAWSTRLGQTSDARQIIETLIHGIVDIAECERGFLLIANADGELHIHACYGLDLSELTRPAFTGSRGAIERAIATQRPVFLTDQGDRAWLLDRASVVARGLRALVCLPLLHDGELLGIAYADTSNAAKLFTDLDAELLSAFADRAASVLTAERIGHQLRGIGQWLTIGQDDAPRAGTQASARSDILHNAN